MNKIYTTVWCESRQQWVVTSELARSSGRPKLAPKKSALALLLGAMLLPSGPAMAVDYEDVTLESGVQSIGSGDTATNTTINGGQQNLASGGIATSTTVNSGGHQDVRGGGTSIITSINSGGSQSIFGDGVATSTTINSGGRQNIFGTATDTTINSGGVQAVSSGGSATSTTINSGGVQYVSNGGSASDTIINSSGAQSVASGGTATDTTINNGGWQYISGGSATDTTINSGGVQNVSGGTATTTTISGGSQYLYGGSATDTIISGGSQTVSGGSTATSTIIYSNGSQRIYSGGSATSTTINNEGWQVVNSGGTAAETTINSGGEQLVSSGGTATDTTINIAGNQFVSSGGTATGTIISGTFNNGYMGGFQTVLSGGTVISTTIDGGYQRVSSGGTATNTTMKSGHQQIFEGGSATSTTISGGSQNVYSGGTVIDTTINDGGLQFVYGTTTDTTIKGGRSWLYTGALADGKTQINTGGELVMDAGSVATDVNITGGTLSVNFIDSLTSGYDPAQIDKLTMDGGNVSFMGNSGDGFAKLNITELSGSGNFQFNTSLADRNANFVTIEQGTGNFGIGVTDSGKEITDHTDLTVNLIHDQGGDIEFEMVTASGRSTRAIDGGTYMYTLFSQQGKDDLNDGNVWYLGALTDEPGEGGNGEKPMTTPATDAVLAMATAGLNVMRSELDSLRVYRNSQDSDRKQGDGNVWGHYLGKKSAIDNSNGAAYKLHQNGFELGGDIVTGFDTGHLVTGGFVTLSNNQVNHERGGKSKIDSYGLGAYATWYDNSGFYVDGALKANRLENNLNARMTNGDSTSGKWHQYGISTALEGGFTFKPMDNMTIEPFVRSTATHINNANVTLSNGMKAETGKARSLTAEAGTRLGTQFALGSTQFAPYFSASVEQEFAKSNTTLINGINSFDNNLNGTSGKYAAGLSAQLTKGTTVYGEMSYRQGSHIEEPIQGVAGIRVSF